MGTRGAFHGVKRLVREADHSPPSSAEVKNAWSYTSTPQYVFMTLYLLALPAIESAFLLKELWKF
jgi:hypothetical protein